MKKFVKTICEVYVDRSDLAKLGICGHIVNTDYQKAANRLILTVEEWKQVNYDVPDVM